MIQKIYINPERELWSNINQRPVLEQQDLTQNVAQIISLVEQNSDQAICDLTLKYEGICLENFKVSAWEIAQAKQQVSQEFKDAVQVAYNNIVAFHTTQLFEEPEVETTLGVRCFRKSVAIQKVGLYIPGGTAPLFSTVLMLGIPAKLAQAKQVVLCTPAQKNSHVAPQVLYCADMLGITEIFKVGGAQAIAAMGVGTKQIPKVDKIFGPGNQWVTKAKELIQQKGVAIDMPAGPSEVLVVADSKADPSFIAADLLAQSEHAGDSQVVLVCTSRALIDKVNIELAKQIQVLDRIDLIRQSLKNSFMVYFPTLRQCFEFSNAYAPEHLIVQTQAPEQYCDMIINAGSVFLGAYACESAGDYASGTNHTLPTMGYAKGYSGVSMDSFFKKITFQSITKQGIKNLGPTIEVLAQSEGLMAHKNAVSIRLKKIEDEQ